MASRVRARSKAIFLRIAAAFLAVILASTVIVASPGQVLAAGENLLTNPGFEAGDTAWEKWGNPVVTKAEKHSGNQSFQVKRNTGGASQSVAVKAGKTYRIGAWVKFAGTGVTSHTISMEYFGSQQGKESLKFSGSTDWEYQEVLFTPTAGVQHVRVSFWNNTAVDYFIDDAMIQEYADDEPPTAPGALKTEHIQNGLKLTWTGSADDSGAETYQLSYKKTEDSGWQTVNVPHVKGQSEYTYNLKNLEAYQVYAIKLTAVDEAGNISDAVIGLEATPGPNLVENPGLETGSVSPWEVWKNLETTKDNPHSGQYALKIKNLTGGGTKKMNATPDTTYLVSFWTRFASAPVTSFGLDFSLFGSTETKVSMTTPVSTEWTKTEGQVQAGSSDKLMRLAMWNTTGVDMFMDDVFVGALPELPENLEPSAPANAKVTGVDWVSADLRWEASEGPYGVEAYAISYKEEGENEEGRTVTVPAVQGQTSYSYKLEGLSPETAYDIEIKAVSEGELVSEGAALRAATSSVRASNPDASAEAISLLERLYDTTGNGIFTGQHNYYEDPSNWYNKAAEITGVYPALWGSDFAYYTGGDLAGLRQKMINTAIVKAQSGAMITLTYHQIRPFDAKTAGWESVKAKVTEEQMEQIVTPGTELYNQWAAQVDEVAGYLSQLKDAGVPVLWRPYHEMNAEFFWWGGRPELFKQLWTNMYDRFTNVHHLDNLIWVWSPNAESEWAFDSAPYYPGHDYVDVLAMDIYNNDYKDAYYEKLMELSGGRPIAIGENGELPDPKVLKERQTRFVYFMTWSEYLTNKNSVEKINSLYHDSRAINNEGAN
ncbi:glycosyl hydrolase [Paenibacillus macerans]|uniref:glycosyl hydrolase n=1 Tax=Paenibacillus macerans TaxID=44252 RepID=UPI00204064E8|nr:glycosyl hydrolase [Paenibacillus macerans]MCM3700280.1 fibronectin type III domain-containing protein [Paenibacillus macerans]